MVDSNVKRGGDNSARPNSANEAAGANDGEQPTLTEPPKRGQSWASLLALDAQIFEKNGIRILTPEARVLIHLKLQGTLSVTTAMQLAGVSYRGFYAVLERLKQAGLVSQAVDKGDQRVRNLSLDPSVPLTPDNV